MTGNETVNLFIINHLKEVIRNEVKNCIISGAEN